MSAGRKRTDLIERTRYPNPLPLPPYPPKLLSIPTPADRYASPAWSSRLADSVPLPLVVDSEGGMPLSLNLFPELWAVDAQGRPTDGSLPPVDQASMDTEDAWLLNPDLANATAPPPVMPGASLKGSAAPNAAAAAAAAANAPPAGHYEDLSAKDVAWLRRTEYIGADRKAKAEAAVRAQRPAAGAQSQVSPEAECARIQESFAAVENNPWQSLTHPTKKGLKPVESFELYPDFDTWSTEMHVLKFSDAPGKHDDQPGSSSGSRGRDTRLPLSIIRKRQDAGTNFLPTLSLFLPSAIPLDVTLQELDEILLADPDAFDDEDREFFADQAGSLDDDVRLAAIVRREEQRRKKGWTGDVPEEPEEEETDEDAAAEYARQRTKMCTPYRHQRDYDPERQGTAEDLQRFLIVNFANSNESAADLPVSRREADFVDGEDSKQRAAAYYHPIESRSNLRVKRAAHRRGMHAEDDEDYWPALALAHRDLSDRELVKRVKRRGQVQKIKEDELPELSESEEEEEEQDEEAARSVLPEGDREADGGSDVDDDEKETERRAAVAKKAAISAAFSDEEEDEDRPTAAAARAPTNGEAKAVADEEDDDDEEEVETSRKESQRPKPAATAEEKEDEGGDDNDDDDDDEDDDASEDTDLESLDADEELAALREEAGGGEDVNDDGEGGGGGRSRRSRRAAAAAAPLEDDGMDEE
ncbi:unnamed protein product [Jaminaea pallidilutea]